MSGEAGQDAAMGGARGAMSATLWVVGSVGLLALVMMWAFELGSRNPADIPALSAEAPWRRAPDVAEGRRIPGGDAQVYAPMTDSEGAAASRVAEAFGAPPPERPTEADLLATAAAPPPLSAIAPDRGERVGQAAFETMARAAAAEAEASGRRTILLDDPVEPLRTAGDFQASGAPAAPPNVGGGAEPPPPNAVFYEPNAAVGDAAPRAVAPGFDGPPDAGSAAVDLAEPIPAPAPELELAAETPPPEAEQLAAAAAAAAPAERTARPAAAAPAAAQSAATDAGAQPAAEGAGAPPAADGPGAAREATSERPPETAVARPPEPEAGAAPLRPAPPSAVGAAPAAPAIYQIQLGALDSVRAVESEWSALKRKAPRLLEPFDLDVQPVNVGGARLYRLRVGSFASRAEAARLCAELRAQGIECFPASG